MQNQIVEPKTRTGLFTFVCIIQFIGIGILAVLFLVALSYDTGLAIVGFVILGLSLGLTIGLWRLKKWAAWTYMVLFVLNQIATLASHSWSPLNFGIQAAMTAVIVAEMKNMDWTKCD